MTEVILPSREETIGSSMFMGAEEFYLFDEPEVFGTSTSGDGEFSASRHGLHMRAEEEGDEVELRGFNFNNSSSGGGNLSRCGRFICAFAFNVRDDPEDDGRIRIGWGRNSSRGVWYRYEDNEFQVGGSSGSTTVESTITSSRRLIRMTMDRQEGTVFETWAEDNEYERLTTSRGFEDTWSSGGVPNIGPHVYDSGRMYLHYAAGGVTPEPIRR